MAATPDEATEVDPFTPARPTPDEGAGMPASAVDEAVPAQRPGGPPPGARPGPRRAPLVVSAAVTTLWAALVSLIPIVGLVLLVQTVSGGDDPVGNVIRVGVAGWLLVHGVPLHTSVGSINLVPLAFTLLAAWRVARAGVHTTRAVGGSRRGSPRLAATVAGAVGLAYGMVGLLAGAVATVPGLDVDVLRAGLTLAAFGFVTAAFGAVKECRGFARLARRTPPPVRDATRTGLVAALLVLGAGAAAAGTSVALSGGAASRVLAAYHTGVAGQIGLTLVCIAYGPNLAVWAASYLIGPGFAMGTGTVVSAGQVSLGTVPALPVLAGVPAGPASAWLGLLLAVPLAAGMVAGWLLVRRRVRQAGGDPAAQAGWLSLLGSALLAGPVAGAALAFAVWASAGSLGSGHLARLGPQPWPLAAIAAGLVAAGAVVAAGATRALIGARRRDGR